MVLFLLSKPTQVLYVKNQYDWSQQNAATSLWNTNHFCKLYNRYGVCVCVISFRSNSFLWNFKNYIAFICERIQPNLGRQFFATIADEVGATISLIDNKGNRSVETVTTKCDFASVFYIFDTNDSEEDSVTCRFFVLWWVILTILMLIPWRLSIYMERAVFVNIH